MATSNQISGTKETIYIDVDDEITSIIEKIKGSKVKIIALVLPKRTTALQSVINMKLLKKAGVNAKKNIVLITSEDSLMPLAAVAGLYVAKSLQSKPAIPPLPHILGDDSDDKDTAKDPQLNKMASIGALAAAAAHDETETIKLDSHVSDKNPDQKTPKPKKDKRLRVPNFERFRLGFFLAIVGFILLIVGWYFAALVLPRATITIKTNTSSAVSSFDFLTSTTTELDVANRKIPATKKDSVKTGTQKVAATGQKDNGAKASGSMTMKNCSSSENSILIPAATRFTSSGFTFLSNEPITLPASTFSGGGNCTTQVRTIDVTAENPGDSYNLTPRTYTVGISGVQANGTAMAGGTSIIVKVLSQKDIDDAAAAVASRLEGQVSNELKSSLESGGLLAITDTQKSTQPKVTSDPVVNQEATEANILVEVTYSMLGIDKDNLNQLILKDVEGEDALKGKTITDNGIDQAIMRINNQPSPTEAFISFRTSVTAGPQIDEVAVKEKVRGKKRGETESYIKNLPGVQDVTISYSPFWVYSTPKATSKITIIVEKSSDN